MARVQLIVPDEDRDRFVQQARMEGMTFSAWLRAAAHERLNQRQSAERFASADDLGRFFRACDTRRGAGVEPDWEEHKRAMEQSRADDLPTV